VIRSRSDYLHYLERDKLALGLRGTLRERLFDDIWRFERLLRKTEYLRNCRSDPFSRIYRRVCSFRLDKLGRLLGFTIPENVFGPGLSIAHRGTIVVNDHCRIGANCRIHVCVNIGAAIDDGRAAPRIGDNCYIGPGAKLYGAIEIAHDITIGANAVVNSSFSEPSITIAGVPARKIGDRGTSHHRPIQSGTS
jgi:serine O-acetyltransferase